MPVARKKSAKMTRVFRPTYSKYSVDAIKLAREMLKNGSGWKETSAKSKIPARTLYRMAKEMAWYIKARDNRALKKIYKQHVKSNLVNFPGIRKETGQGDDGGGIGGVAPPPGGQKSQGGAKNGEHIPPGGTGGGGEQPPTLLEDPIQACVELFRWALGRVTAEAGQDTRVQFWLVQNLPGAIRNLALAQDQIIAKPADPTADLRAEMERRLALVAPPTTLTTADAGEEPTKEGARPVEVDPIETAPAKDPGAALTAWPQKGSKTAADLLHEAQRTVASLAKALKPA